MYTFTYVPLSTIVATETNFTGQKLLHALNRVEITKTTTRFHKKKKKNIEYTTRTKVYDDKFMSKDVEEDIKNATSIQLKHDGCCGCIVFDEKTQELIPYTRYDIKRNKKTKEFNEPEKGWIQCEPKPTKPEATHWPHMRRCSEEPKQYKHQIYAFEQAKKSGMLDDIKKTFMCEYMGKKVNYKKEDPIDENCLIVPHGSYSIDIPIEKRNYTGFREVMEMYPDIEGFVIYGKLNTYKIRRDAFSGLDWPSGATNDKINRFSEKAALGHK
jgi:hypothetical protein